MIIQLADRLYLKSPNCGFSITACTSSLWEPLASAFLKLAKVTPINRIGLLPTSVFFNNSGNIASISASDCIGGSVVLLLVIS